MRRNRAAILAGGGLIALQAGLAFGLSSAAPLLGMFHPFGSVLGLRTEPILGSLRLLGGVPGGFLAGFASRNEQGEPDAIRGLISGVAAGVTGLVLAYVAYLLVIVILATLGRPLPLSPLYLATVVPLTLGAPVIATVPVGALFAGGIGAVVADPATDLRGFLFGRHPETTVDEEPAAEEGSPDLPERVERLTERAVYAPDEVDLGELVALLERDDPAVRAAAVRALAGMPRSHLDGVAGAVPALVGFLDAEDRGDRHRAAEAIARIADADPGAVAPAAERLVGRLPDADVRVRNHLADALRSLAGAMPEHAAVVLELLDADDPAVRGASVSVLGAAPSAATPALDRLIDLFEDAPYNRDGIAPILAAIAREDPSAVAPATPALIGYLEALEDDDAREATIEALARIAVHDPEAARPAVDALADALRVSEDPLRETIAEGVVAILRAFPEDAEAVEGAITTGDSWQRYGAERALEDAAGDGIVGDLLGD